MTEPIRKIPVIRSQGFLWYCDKSAPGHEDFMGPNDHEKELAPFFREYLPKGGVFLDVGAHVGHWTVRLASRARRVICIEANPDTARILRLNVQMNKLRNVVVHNVAAWDCDTELMLFNPSNRDRSGGTRVLEEDGSGVLIIEEGEVQGDLGMVPATTLDSLLADERAVDLVKLDVEGADLHALEGMRGLLERHRPVMIIERHDMYGYYDLADLAALLHDLNYEHKTAWAQYFLATPRDKI